MKQIVLALAALIISSTTTFAAEGVVETKANMHKQGTLGVFIYGAAADDISRNLFAANVKFVRDRFSGQLVQTGRGIRCIKADESAKIYCFLQIASGAVD